MLTPFVPRLTHLVLNSLSPEFSLELLRLAPRNVKVVPQSRLHELSGLSVAQRGFDILLKMVVDLPSIERRPHSCTEPEFLRLRMYARQPLPRGNVDRCSTLVYTAFARKPSVWVPINHPDGNDNQNAEFELQQ